MKKPFYVLENHSSSTGTYEFNNEYYYLVPDEVKILSVAPHSRTANVQVSVIFREVTENKTTNKKPVKVEEGE